MNRALMLLSLPVWLFLAIAPAWPFSDSPKPAVQDLKKIAVKVFIDCRGCDRDFFRQEITYVNYVRDRMDADVHVLITEQQTGSGGREYTFAFIGLKDFEGLNYTLVCDSGPTDTRDEIRREQVEVLERGLFPYVVQTPLAKFFFLDFRQELEPTAVIDPWNFWVFSISLDGRLRGEQTQNSRSLDLNLSVNRVTPEMKIRFGLSGEFDKQTYDYEDEYIESASEEENFSGMAVKSLGEHWGIGGWIEVEASTYSNLDLLFTIAPAVEYNFFPYSESTRHQLRFLYRIGYKHANYIEETIFGKMSQTLFNQSLTLSLQIREPWGSASTSVEGSHYFNNLSKYRIELWANLDIRLFKGLSLDIFGRYERIHDQLSLAKGEASLEELLLARKELATNYEYSISLGLRYTFGSVYSNVVNPRFGRTRFRR
jgi:hypothetical protein